MKVPAAEGIHQGSGPLLLDALFSPLRFVSASACDCFCLFRSNLRKQAAERIQSVRVVLAEVALDSTDGPTSERGIAYLHLHEAGLGQSRKTAFTINDQPDIAKLCFAPSGTAHLRLWVFRTE